MQRKECGNSAHQGRAMVCAKIRKVSEYVRYVHSLYTQEVQHAMAGWLFQAAS